MEGKDRFLLAALGFSATSTIALAAVLLAFAVTGGFEAVNGDRGGAAASVALYGVNVAIERFGVAEALCVKSGGASWLYASRDDGSIAFIVLRVESEDGSTVTVTRASFTTGSGELELAVTDTVFVGVECDAPLIINDAVPYNGSPLEVDDSGRVVIAFHADRGFERAGVLAVGVAGKTGEYSVEFEFKRCRVAGLKVSSAHG